MAGTWRFLYGPCAPQGGHWGDVGQAANRTLTLRSEPDQNHEVSFDLDGANSAAAAQIMELETDIHVMYGNSYVFAGRVLPTQDVLDASRHTETVTADCYRAVLKRRAFLPGDTVSYTNMEQQQIAWKMLQTAQGHPGGNLGIVQGAGSGGTGVQQTVTYAVGDYIGDDIASLAGLQNGFEWQINPYGPDDLRLDVFYPWQGRDKGVVLAYGQGRVAQITRNVDPSTYGNAVYVTGDSSVTLAAQQLDMAGISAAPGGRWDSVIGTSDKTQSALNADAAQQLAQAQALVPSYTVDLHSGTWGGPSDIWLGDTVTLRIKSGRLNVNDQLRVVEMVFAINSSGQEQLSLTIGRLPFRLHKAIAAALKQIKYLNTR